MLGRFTPTIGTTLPVLFGTMTAIVIGALGVPIYGEVRQLQGSERVVQVAQAGREVFTALQNTRTQRGPSRNALAAKSPASPAFMAMIADLRLKADPAIAHVVGLCQQIDCTGGKTEIAAGLPASLDRLATIRKESDAALALPLDQRRAGLVDDFNKAATDVIDRLEAMSNALGEAIRMVDTDTAELMAIKQAAWLARDGIGLERTTLSEARTKNELSPTLDRKMADLRGRALVNWSVLKDLVARPGAPAELRDLAKAAQSVVFDSYEKTRRAAYDDIAAKQPPSINNDDLDRIGNTALDALTAIPNTAMRLAQTHAEQRHQDAVTALTWQTGLLAAVLALAVAGFVIVRTRVTRPITTMTSAMRRLAGGDLDGAIPGAGRRDEIGAMASAVEIFKHDAAERRHLAGEADRIRTEAEAEKRRALADLAQGFGSRVGTLVNGLVSASGQLEATANKMSETADVTSGQSAVLAGSARETGSSVQAVAAATEELATSASEIGAQIGKTAQTARQAVEDVRHTDQTVQALSTAAEKIETVVALINEIASRTNLLALNATIEAARAGDAGRGFAVVASEVKDLANQTIKATGEIATQVSQLQQATSGAVAAIQTIAGRIEEVHATANAIAAAAEEQQAATAEIARSISQAAQGTQLVDRSIGTVQDAAATTGSSAGEVLASARDLATCSSDLRSEMNSFIAAMQAA